MGKLEEALRDKISLLEAKKIELQGELEEAFQQIDSQVELCESLLTGDVDGFLEDSPKKRGRPKKTDAKSPAKKRGRPRKKSPEDEKNKKLYEEAVNSLPEGSTGTTAEQQERAVRRFNPTPRGEIGQPGVAVGGNKGKPAPTKEPDSHGHKTISMEDDLEEEK
jgi:hypothetical protein